MFYADGLDAHEIAQVLGLTVSEVDSTLTRLRGEARMLMSMMDPAARQASGDRRATLAV